ncbi:substrate-binding periplasmic protein [Leeia aquatica]|uniref:Transporter substrate-binding domain-containing protein n=1 Tax=Leeia aquatica TaxID=2725557 RepID=A0A847SEJ7_9NEIS|nr:transporter substrate-binding domain-containing protein [Leeia aquatica]NLR75709.1 transporter substrate-binding domain-containing protein [Leeia aquatica]
MLRMVFCMCLLWWTLPAHATLLEVVTEEGPPLQYLEQGQIRGAGAEFVERLLHRAGYSYRLSMVPWARAELMATTQPNVLIFSIARTPIRESQYQWIGRLLTIQYSLFRLGSRGDIQLERLEDAKVWRIGVVKGDVRANWLRDQGFAYASGTGPGLEEAPTPFDNLRKLQAGRVDLIPSSTLGLVGFCQQTGQRCDQLLPILDLPFRAELYLAASQGTAPDILDRLRKAYGQLVKDGSYDRMLGGYQAQ